MRKAISTLLFLCVISVVSATYAGTTDSYSRYYENLPFKTKQLTAPIFPDNKISVAETGGKGNGLFKNTEAFARAVEALSQKGGGTLIVPLGVWLTGPITLKSNINLHLEKGAIIVFSPDYNDYPLINTFFEGLATKRCTSPINANGATNIAITGEGTIDGNGGAWRMVKKMKTTEPQWRELTRKGVMNERGDEWYPTEGSMKGSRLSSGNFNIPAIKNEADWEEIRPWLRPVMVSLIKCKGILLQGVTFQNSPSWNIHPNMCEDIIVDGATIRNPWFAQNGDGLDLESCTNALVVNSSFDVGDDAICIKSGKDAEGRKRGMPCQNIVVDNCMVFHGHGAFVVGSEMSGGARNISVRNCRFMGTDVGLRFKSNRGRGGVVENIFIENITMIDIPTEPLLFDLFYGGKSAVEALEDGDEAKPKTELLPKVSEETPVFKNIFIKNVSCRGARRAMFFNGLPEMPIRNVVIENFSAYATLGAELNEVEGVVLKNIEIDTEEGSALKVKNASNLAIDYFTTSNTEKAINLSGHKNKEISISNSTIYKK